MSYEGQWSSDYSKLIDYLSGLWLNFALSTAQLEYEKQVNEFIIAQLLHHLWAK